MAFRGEVALITGAGSGLGQLSAWRLAAGGARVAALDIDRDGLAETARHAPSVRAWRCDVSDAEAVAVAVVKVEAEFGQIDRVVNAAAIAPSGPLVEQDPDTIRRLTEVNYLGTAYVTLATLPAMIERGHGDLVNYASMGGWMPFKGLGGYCATKFAVVGFTEALADENAGSGVRFACVCPPLVSTPMIDVIDAGTPGYALAPMISPEEVVEGVERSLERGQLFVFPGRGTRMLWQLRRFVPVQLTKFLDRQMSRVFAGAQDGVSTASPSSSVS